MPQDWSWPRSFIRGVAQGVQDSSPGSDGMPYSFWRMAPPIFHETVDELMEQASHGTPLPYAMSHTTTATIPKAEVEVEAASIRCTASTIRPITLMRVSSKLAALVANRALRP